MIDTKRLRQKILDLAIRGKLVPQDPTDEPASALLERIRAEKLQMVADGKLKKKDIAKDSIIYRGDDNSHYEKVGDGEPVCIDDELPFMLPDRWEWARLNSIVVSVADGDHQPPPQSPEGIPFLVISNVASGVLNFNDTRYVSRDYYDSLGEYRKPAKSDVLYTVTGSYGIALVVPDDRQFCVQRHIGIVRPSKSFSSGYLCRCLQSGWIKSCADVAATGIAQKTVGLNSIRGFLVPIPPLAEQRRIVAALDEHLALVDEIERNQEELESLLAKARSKVLDLAIRGKLVPQNPADEPASALLERIRAEKLQMVADGRLKKKDIARDSVIYRGEDNSYYERFTDGRDNLLEDELFELPTGWSWTRLGVITDYGHASSADPQDIPVDAWVLDLEDIEKETGRVLQHLTLNERSSSSTKRPFEKGQLLYSKLRPYLNKVLIAPERGFCTSEILPVQTYGEVSPGFLRTVLMSNYFLAYANRCSYGVKMPRLGTKDGQKALVPLPPLVEQNRIVQRVEVIVDMLTLAPTM